MRSFVVVVAVCGIGCKAKPADNKPPAPQPPSRAAEPPEEPPPAKPSSGDLVICSADPDKFELAGWPVALHGSLVQVAVDPAKGLVVSAVASAKVLGSVAVPAGMEARIKGVTATREGLAVLVALRASHDDDGALQLARFNTDGSPHGALVPVPPTIIHFPMPGLSLGSFDDTLVLFEETKAMAHSQVQLMDLDLKLVGEPVDTGRGRIGHWARIGRSHVFATFLRDHESDSDTLRVFDADKRAWLGPQFETGQPNVYGAADFGADAIVMMGVGSGVHGATLDATGKLGAWKDWDTSAEAGGKGVVTTPDGKHTFAVWTTDLDKTVHIATIKTDLSLANDQTSPSAGFSSILVADNAAIYEGSRRYSCKAAK
jgi:hypothetical protein